jgi:uncharacterized membrane protein
MELLLRFGHLLAAAVWIGGMFFAHFCLRPAAFESLQPPQRLPLMVGALARFFRWVALAIALLWATGGIRMAQVGPAAAPAGWLVMAGLAAVMTVVFGVIAHGVFPGVREAVAEGRFPDAARGLDRIRRLVAVNLGLGVATIATATLWH